MNELFVPYNIALLAKQKGFKEGCFGRFNSNYKDNRFQFLGSPLEPRELQDWNQLGKQYTSAPLYQQLVDWFRVKHNIVVQVDLFDYGLLVKNKPCFQYRIFNKSDSNKETYIGINESLDPYEMWNEAFLETFKLLP